MKDFLLKKYTTVFKPAFIVFLLSFSAIWIFSTFFPFGINWNITPSIPKGVYLSVKYKGQILNKGDFVCFKYSSPSWAKDRKYLNEGFQLCKQIIGMSGDSLFFNKEAKTLQVGGTSIKLIEKDTRGRPLPSDTFTEGLSNIGPGMLFLKGVDDPKSLDSRYLGLINQREIVKIIIPLITYN